jgi:hypothetical protein
MGAETFLMVKNCPNDKIEKIEIWAMDSNTVCLGINNLQVNISRISTYPKK